MEFSFFENLPEKVVQEFVDASSYRHFETATELLSQGEMSEGVFLILSGGASISISQPNGDQANLVRVGRGELIGDIEALTGKPCLASASAEPGTSVALWQRDALQLFLSCPLIARNVITLFYDRMAIINHVRTVEHRANVDQKVYACLLRMAASDNIIRHSQSYIAEAVGCSRQTANRVLGQLRDDGIVSLRKARIELLDAPRLQAMLGAA